MQFNDHLDEVLAQLGGGGAFLTVRSEELVNTMTIGWGLIGIQWSMPVFTVLVRKSRYTHSLMDGAGDFTVSVPADDRWKKALAFCGSHSGVDVDKFAACGLVLKPAKETLTPVIAGGGFTYECEIIYRSPLDLAEVGPDVQRRFQYTAEDIHTLYTGKIVACYKDA